MTFPAVAGLVHLGYEGAMASDTIGLDNLGAMIRQLDRVGYLT